MRNIQLNSPNILHTYTNQLIKTYNILPKILFSCGFFLSFKITFLFYKKSSDNCQSLLRNRLLR